MANQPFFVFARFTVRQHAVARYGVWKLANEETVKFQSRTHIIVLPAPSPETVTETVHLQEVATRNHGRTAK